MNTTQVDTAQSARERHWKTFDVSQTHALAKKDKPTDLPWIAEMHHFKFVCNPLHIAVFLTKISLPLGIYAISCMAYGKKSQDHVGSVVPSHKLVAKRLICSSYRYPLPIMLVKQVLIVLGVVGALNLT
jgi:hypothetical protein